ncbi:hypothetical protein F4805DRAFT_403184 [Annulohypoxylon moriforme]|nr:hypothetical protein F4805DRAFT_403184 [Annulohypoxylon moriforme]
MLKREYASSLLIQGEDENRARGSQFQTANDDSLVQTDMGNEGAKIFGMDEATVTVDDTIDFVKDQTPAICRSTRQLAKMSGRFPPIDGGETER